MFKSAKRYWDQGFGVLWLRPKSKSPMDLGWTKGPRKKWKELVSQYKLGMNVGVRLGAVSNLGSEESPKYLCVIDIDVKSSEERHRKEAYAKVKELLNRECKPTSLSGRGNGSGHIFFFSKKPVMPRRLGQSSDITRVLMPSSDKPSKRELDSLTKIQLKEGYRLRPAWEISLMGEGQQVVLPPSVHPDTGKEYKWNQKFDPQELPDSINVKIRDEKDSDTPEQFKRAFKEVSLEWSSLPQSTIEKIQTGEGVENRSDEMFAVTMQMLRRGFSDDEIISVMTDKENWIALASFEHAKTSKRIKAAHWFKRYTLKKAKEKVDPKNSFDLETGETIEEPLSDEEIWCQEIELESDWRNEIERTSGPESPPKGSLKNTILILGKAVDQKLFIRNEFSGRDYYGVTPPWGRKKGQELNDDDSVLIKDWFSREYKFEPKVSTIFEAMVVMAHENRFHPVRDYLNKLSWDGQSRLNHWLPQIFKIESPKEYIEEVCEKIILAMIARVFQPGCKFDQVPILEGKQGYGKSSIARILAEPWFNDTPVDIRDKDAMLNLVGSWVNELSELSTMNRSDSETYKAFFTRQVDRVRAPYGRRWQEIPRQCVFLGTTNYGTYLKDRTGNRRFWPIKLSDEPMSISEINRRLDKLREIKDQLFAEGKVIYDALIAPVGPDGRELQISERASELAREIQESKVQEDVEDSMDSLLNDYILNKDGDLQIDLERFKLMDLFEPAGPFERFKADNYHIQLAGRILAKNGFKKRKLKGMRFWGGKVGLGGAGGEN